MLHLKTSPPLVVLFLLFTLKFFAQENQYIDHAINSLVFEKERKVKVMLPERYFRDTTTDFIVTYVLDTQSDEYWSMAIGNISYNTDIRNSALRYLNMPSYSLSL